MDWKFEEADEVCRQLDQLGELFAPDRNNWAMALMNLERFQDALLQYRALLQSDSQVSAYWTDLGACLWILGDKLQALDAWRSALKCKYQRLGGGVEDAALLYYAAKWLCDGKAAKEATAKLRKFWKSKLMQWPASLSGYLLGDVSQTQLFNTIATDGSPLEIQQRRSCQAHFWVAVDLKSSAPSEAKKHLEKCLEIKGPSLLETERYLAKWELAAGW